MDYSIAKIRQNLIGINEEVLTLDGKKQYINFDNAASTPTFNYIKERIDLALRWYSNVERGTGFKSQVSTWALEKARDILAEFVGADIKKDVTIFTKNTTEGINHLANCFKVLSPENHVVLSTAMEHHSNDLPWRNIAQVVYAKNNSDGSVNMEDFKAKLEKYQKQLILMTVAGASNVSGVINPIHEFARLAHQYGVKIVVDAAQLAPHRPIDMKSHDDPEHLDFVVFSGHKMYAPFGAGVLIGDKQIFEYSYPDFVGGGTVTRVGKNNVIWAPPPERHEAGTVPYIGAVSVAAAANYLRQLGWDNIIRHQQKLTAYALTKMANIPGLHIYGPTNPDDLENRLGVITFNIDDVSHRLVAAVLNYEGAIGVRNGLFCSHQYTLQLMGKSGQQEFVCDCASGKVGAVRASFGIYNTLEEIDEFIHMLQVISVKGFKGEYDFYPRLGRFIPEGWTIKFSDYFKF